MKILVIDETDPALERTIADMLENKGHTVVGVQSTTWPLDVVIPNHGFMAVITCLEMPRFTAIEVLQCLESSGSVVPVFVYNTSEKVTPEILEQMSVGIRSSFPFADLHQADESLLENIASFIGSINQN
jgi:CheY-like chemotaxis protein